MFDDFPFNDPDISNALAKVLSLFLSDYYAEYKEDCTAVDMSATIKAGEPVVPALTHPTVELGVSQRPPQ